MITKEFLDAFIKKFEHCKDVDAKWNSKLFEKTDSDSWSKLLLRRSRDLRHTFEVNEQNIASLREAISGDLSEEEYRLLSDAALQIYQDGYDDICVFPLLLEPCIEHYKETRNLDYLIPLMHAYCFEYEQADLEGVGSPKYAYESILEFKDDYANIPSRYARLTLFKSYSNIISRILNNEEKGSFMQMYRLYLEALSIWNDPKTQALDGKDEEFIYFVDRMFLTLMLYENIAILSEEEMALYERLIEESKEKEGEETNSMVRCVEQVLHNYQGKITNVEVVDYLLKHFDDVFSLLDPNADPNEQEDYLDDVYNIIATLCSYMEGEKNTPSRHEEVKERMHRLRLFIFSLPYHFFTGEMNRYAYMLFQRIRPYMTFEEKKEYLLEVVMFRQPITCIHSLMVERIALVLADYLLANRPELFVGVLNTKNKEEVSERKEELISFVKDCALYHDIGKITLVDIINTQNRRLTDAEFKKIKMHPENGLSILDNDPDFASYYDAFKGHHRFYNGQGGYPSDFDNLSSPIRFVIDLVTIADCTDAATDILGRNYTKGKTFRVVLQEFLAGAGTRYNPDIVQAIASDESLIETLTSLVTDGRAEVYKEVYSRYIS